MLQFTISLVNIPYIISQDLILNLCNFISKTKSKFSFRCMLKQHRYFMLILFEVYHFMFIIILSC